MSISLLRIVALSGLALGAALVRVERGVVVHFGEVCVAIRMAERLAAFVVLSLIRGASSLKGSTSRSSSSGSCR